jgi:hypothetical protein
MTARRHVSTDQVSNLQNGNTVDQVSKPEEQRHGDFRNVGSGWVEDLRACD